MRHENISRLHLLVLKLNRRIKCSTVGGTHLAIFNALIATSSTITGTLDVDLHIILANDAKKGRKVRMT